MAVMGVWAFILCTTRRRDIKQKNWADVFIRSQQFAPNLSIGSIGGGQVQRQT